MFEFTPRDWITITGRGRFALLDFDQLDRNINIGDPVRIDGVEYTIKAIETYRRQLGITHISELYNETPPPKAVEEARAAVAVQARRERRRQRRARQSFVAIAGDR